MSLLEFKRALMRVAREQASSTVRSVPDLLRILVRENTDQSFIVGGITDPSHDWVGAVVSGGGNLLGSCVYIGRGRVLTCYHVIKASSVLRITFSTSCRNPPFHLARVVAIEPGELDLALLQIPDLNRPAVSVGRPPVPLTGMAIGYGYTWDGRQLTGEGVRRSARLQIEGGGVVLRLHSSSAAVCWYDSGGAVLSSESTLVGIIRSSKECELGFATSLVSAEATTFVRAHGG